MEVKTRDIDLLDRAAKLLLSNFNLSLFLLLCSVPLFCFLIVFELSLQTTVSLTFQFLSQQLNSGEDLLENDLIPWLLKTSLLYYIPYNFLDLLTTTMIVASSSIVYTSEEEPFGLVYLVRRSVKICKNRAKGCLITSLYVIIFSTSVLFGFLSDSTNYLFIASLSYKHESFHNKAEVLFHAVVALIHATVFIVLIARFSKWSAGWNMGLVVSVLEEEDGEGIYGSDALSLSAWYGRGHEKRDLQMMLMFLVFALVMRMPCFYFKCSECGEKGVLYTCLYVGFICIGNVVKWVSCVVCYHDYNTRVMGRSSDVEQAKPPSD